MNSNTHNYVNVKQTGGNQRIIVTRCHIHKLSDENLVTA